jgi:NAD(P)H-dependent FMN reductase
LEQLAKKILAADGYVMVSPEYNHSMSPALAHLLNHFGSSLFWVTST